MQESTSRITYSSKGINIFISLEDIMTGPCDSNEVSVVNKLTLLKSLVTVIEDNSVIGDVLEHIDYEIDDRANGEELEGMGLVSKVEDDDEDNDDSEGNTMPIKLNSNGETPDEYARRMYFHGLHNDLTNAARAFGVNSTSYQNAKKAFEAEGVYVSNGPRGECGHPNCVCNGCEHQSMLWPARNDINGDDDDDFDPGAVSPLRFRDPFGHCCKR